MSNEPNPPAGEEKVEIVEPAKPEGEAKPTHGSDPTVPLSDYSVTKEALSRLVERTIGDDPDKLKELAEEDPKLAQRIKDQFPKRFKDVEISNDKYDPKELDARVRQVAKDLINESSNRAVLESVQSELGMSDIEFDDIKERIEAKANNLVKSETVTNYKQAVSLALKLVDPKAAALLEEKRAVKMAKDRINNSANSGGGKKSEVETEADTIAKRLSRNLPPGFSSEKKH